MGKLVRYDWIENKVTYSMILILIIGLNIGMLIFRETISIQAVCISLLAGTTIAFIIGMMGSMAVFVPEQPKLLFHTPMPCHAFIDAKIINNVSIFLLGIICWVLNVNGYIRYHHGNIPIGQILELVEEMQGADTYIPLLLFMGFLSVWIFAFIYADIEIWKIFKMIDVQSRMPVCVFIILGYAFSIKWIVQGFENWVQLPVRIHIAKVLGVYAEHPSVVTMNMMPSIAVLIITVGVYFHMRYLYDHHFSI